MLSYAVINRSRMCLFTVKYVIKSFFDFDCFVFQAEDSIRDLVRSRGLGDVYKRQHNIRM